MLEKPDLQDETLTACLQEEWGLRVKQLAFLPLGADRNTAVYRAEGRDGASYAPYFVKLRRGAFHDLPVRLPWFLHEQGLRQIIAPLPTRDGQLWAGLEPFKVILYPFIEGRDGYEVALTGRQWVELGAALKRVHTLALPAGLAGLIPREAYSPQGREAVKAFLARVEEGPFVDPVAEELAVFLQAKRGEVLDLVERAGRLARALQDQPAEFVLCHSDVHAGNLLITDRGEFYIVDWDDPILAPKERDLMYPGGGQGFLGHTLQEEEELFYRGYGPAQVNPFALAYYRYERIVQDIYVYCEDLLLTAEGGEDREQSLRFLKSNFLPGGTIEVAYRADRTMGF